MTGARLSPRCLPRLAGFLAAAILMAAGVASAAPAGSPPAASAANADVGGPRWNELSESQRKVLAPLGGDWNSIDSRGKERWLGVAARFPKMPAEEQQRANQRMVEWSHMTPAERTQARMNFQETREVSKQEREARWKAYQALPDDKKRELAAKRAAAPQPASAASIAVANRKRHPPVEDVQPKNNVVDAVPGGRVPLEPGSTVLRTSAGATTTLLTKRTTPPAHQHEGQPKIAAGPGVVDRKTLLPKKGPQATVSAAASTGAPPRP